MTTIDKQGRRFYLRGLPFSLKEQAKDAGCKWDGAERCWWTGKADVAETIANAAGEPPSEDSAPKREAPGQDAIVAGRATYKGKAYFVAGVVDRGRTRYDDRVSPVQTRDGQKYLLHFRDGSSSFWASREDVQVSKKYDRPQTIRRLAEFAAQAKANDGYVPRRGVDYCGERCPVDGHTCTADNPCHDCR